MLSCDACLTTSKLSWVVSRYDHVRVIRKPLAPATVLTRFADGWTDSRAIHGFRSPSIPLASAVRPIGSLSTASIFTVDTGRWQKLAHQAVASYPVAIVELRINFQRRSRTPARSRVSCMQTRARVVCERRQGIGSWNRGQELQRK